MFDLIFGLFWTIFSSLIFFPLLFTDDSEVTLGLIFFALLFEGVGIWMLTKGIKRVVTDRKTDKYGVTTYGIVTAIRKTGCYINEIPELKAEILAYVPSEGTVKVFNEIIGLAPAKYETGTFVLLNQYENDVNIIESTEECFIPRDIFEKINVQPPKNKTVVIDGYTCIEEDLFIDKTDIF